MISSIRLHKWFYGVIAGLVITLLAEGEICAQSDVYRDNQIKAVFIYNLTNFVTWSEKKSGEKTSNLQPEFQICLLGGDPFKRFIDEAVGGESVNGQPIVVKRYKKIFDLKLDTCKILYIDRKLFGNLAEILESTEDKKILTVGDTPGFAEKGGMINLVRKKRHIKIEVNLDSVKKSGLKLNSKLLQLARIVGHSSSSGDN
jgi:hypothetical protein